MKSRLSEEEKRKKENGLRIIEENRRRWEKSVEKEKKERESRSKQKEGTKPKGSIEQPKPIGSKNVNEPKGFKMGQAILKGQSEISSKPPIRVLPRAQSAQIGAVGLNKKSDVKKDSIEDKKRQLNNYVKGVKQAECEGEEIEEEIECLDEENQPESSLKQEYIDENRWRNDYSNDQIGYKELTGYKVRSSYPIYQEKSREPANERTPWNQIKPGVSETSSNFEEEPVSYANLNGRKENRQDSFGQLESVNSSNGAGFFRKEDLDKQRESYGSIKKGSNPFEQEGRPCREQEEVDLNLPEDDGNEESDMNLVTEKEFKLDVKEYPQEVKPNALKAELMLRSTVKEYSEPFYEENEIDQPGPVIEVDLDKEEVPRWKKSTKAIPYEEIGDLKEDEAEGREYIEEYLEDEELENESDESEDLIMNAKAHGFSLQEESLQEKEETRGRNAAKPEVKPKNPNPIAKQTFDYQEFVANALQKVSNVKEFSGSQKEKFRIAQNKKREAGIGHSSRNSEGFNETGHFNTLDEKIMSDPDQEELLKEQWGKKEKEKFIEPGQNLKSSGKVLTFGKNEQSKFDKKDPKNIQIVPKNKRNSPIEEEVEEQSFSQINSSNHFASKEEDNQESEEEEINEDLEKEYQTAKFLSLKDSGKGSYTTKNPPKQTQVPRTPIEPEKGERYANNYQVENESRYLYQSSCSKPQSNVFSAGHKKNQYKEPEMLIDSMAYQMKPNESERFGKKESQEFNDMEAEFNPNDSYKFSKDIANENFNSQEINPIEDVSEMGTTYLKNKHYPQEIFGFGVESMVQNSRVFKGKEISKKPEIENGFVDDYEFLPGNSKYSNDDDLSPKGGKPNITKQSYNEPERGRGRYLSRNCYESNAHYSGEIEDEKATYGSRNEEFNRPVINNLNTGNIEAPKRGSVNRGKWGGQGQSQKSNPQAGLGWNEKNEGASGLRFNVDQEKEEAREQERLRQQKFDVLEIKNDVDEAAYQKKLKKLEFMRERREKSKEAIKKQRENSKEKDEIPVASYKISKARTTSSENPIFSPKSNIIEVQPYEPPAISGKERQGTNATSAKNAQHFKFETPTSDIQDKSQFTFSQKNQDPIPFTNDLIEVEKTAHFGPESFIPEHYQNMPSSDLNKEKNPKSACQVAQNDYTNTQKYTKVNPKPPQQYSQIYEESKTQNEKGPNQTNNPLTPRASDAKKPRASVPAFSHKSNKAVLKNSIKQVCLAGAVVKKDQDVVLKAVEDAVADHLVILFKGRHDFRALYKFDVESGCVSRLFFLGNLIPPDTLHPEMVNEWFRYDSGAKEFKPIKGNRSFSKVVDAVSLKQPTVNSKRGVH